MREVYAEDERQSNNQYIITVTTKTLMEEEKRGKLKKLESFSTFNKVSSRSHVTLKCVCLVVKTSELF